MPTAVDTTHGLSLRDRKDLLWSLGSLRHLVRDHQLPIYDAFWAWQERRQDPELKRQWRELGAFWPELFVLGISRRWGKTALLLIWAIEFCIRRPNSDGILCTAFQSSIASIIRKLIAEVIAPQAPEGYCPEYRSTKDGVSELLFIPATNSTIRLVGLDRHADKTRGNALDFFLLTEAGFTSMDLKDTYQSVIVHQMRGRPWAWSLMESSFSPQADHCFHRDFAEDAAKRGAYHERTIFEAGLSQDEIEEEFQKCGGRGSHHANRELENIHSIDPDRAVCSKFNTGNILAPELWEPPKYAFGVVGLDPGNTDQAGLVFLVVEPSKQLATCVWSWGGAKTSTDDLVTIIREQERALWGTKADTKVQEAKRPLADILKAHREVPLQTVQIERLSIDNPTLGGWGQVYDAPDGTCTWWDDTEKTLRPNPWIRVMDVKPDQIQDMRERHGLIFHQPGKAEGNMKLQIDLLNDHLRDGTLRILDNDANQPLLRQMRNGRWNERRKDFEASKLLAHLDIVVALAIACRMIRWDIDPRRPIHVDPFARGFFTPRAMRKLMEPLRSKEKQRRRIQGKRYR